MRQIENQNLHALNIPELTIITPAALQTEAERVAQLHREEGLTVAVIEQFSTNFHREHPMPRPIED